MPQEEATHWDCPGSKRKLPNEGEQVPCFVALEWWDHAYNSVSSSASLSEGRRMRCWIESSSRSKKVYKGGSWALHLLHCDWDTELVTDSQELSKMCCI